MAMPNAPLGRHAGRQPGGYLIRAQPGLHPATNTFPRPEPFSWGDCYLAMACLRAASGGTHRAVRVASQHASDLELASIRYPFAASLRWVRKTFEIFQQGGARGQLAPLASGTLWRLCDPALLVAYFDAGNGATGIPAT